MKEIYVPQIIRWPENPKASFYGNCYTLGCEYDLPSPFLMQCWNIENGLVIATSTINGNSQVILRKNNAELQVPIELLSKAMQAMFRAQILQMNGKTIPYFNPFDILGMH